MKATVVYESIFGTTRQIADAIAAGLSPTFEVEVVEVGTADPKAAARADLLVLGGPTHMWSMSRGFSRRSGREMAARQGIVAASQGIGVREFLAALPPSPGALAAAFDTGAGKVGMISGGSAARAIADRLDDLGYFIVTLPEQFIITADKEATVLKEGEVDRARAWGTALAARAHARRAA